MTRAEYIKTYRANHREKLLAQMKAYAQKHKLEISLWKKNNHQANKIPRLARMKANYGANRAERIAKAGEYAKANPEKVKVWAKNSRLRHPETQHVHRHNRRARNKQALGRLDKAMVQRVFEDNIKKFGQLTCYLCFQPIEFGKSSIDHRVPLARGGSNLYENLQVAHLTCNLRKNKRTEAEYHLRFTEVFCD